MFFTTSSALPIRRTQNLIAQNTGDEVLLYDEQTHKAFCLNAVAAAVWKRCDGATSVAAIATSASLALNLPLTEELVQVSLQELTRDGLLEADELTILSAVSRRDLMVRLGVRAALLLPIVAAIAAPKAAHAYNGCVDC